MSFSAAYEKYQFEINTFLWHLRYPKPIEWNGLKITVPDYLVAKNVNRGLLIYKMQDAGELLIRFQEMDKPYSEDTNLQRMYAKANWELTDKKVAIIFGREAIWIEASRTHEKDNYLEEIIMISDPIRVSFIGEESNRGTFEEVIKNVQWDADWAEKMRGQQEQR